MIAGIFRIFTSVALMLIYTYTLSTNSYIYFLSINSLAKSVIFICVCITVKIFILCHTFLETKDYCEENITLEIIGKPGHN